MVVLTIKGLVKLCYYHHLHEVQILGMTPRLVKIYVGLFLKLENIILSMKIQAMISLDERLPDPYALAYAC